MVEGWVYSVVASIAAGYLVKSADDLADSGSTSLTGYIFAILYGMAIAAIFVFHPPLLPLWLGGLAGVVAAGKIDNPIHLTGVAVVAVLTFILPFELIVQHFALGYAAVFFVAAFADEKFQKSENPVLAMVSGRRLFLEIAAVLVTMHYVFLLGYGDYSFLLSILGFDAAYILSGYLAQRAGKQKRKEEREETVQVQEEQAPKIVSLPANAPGGRPPWMQ